MNRLIGALWSMLACAIIVWGIDGRHIWNLPVVAIAMAYSIYFNIKADEEGQR